MLTFTGNQYCSGVLRVNVKIGLPADRNIVWKDVIIDILRKSPEGLTTSDIAERAVTSRHTVSVVLAELKGEGRLDIRKVGVAKLHYLIEGDKGE